MNHAFTLTNKLTLFRMAFSALLIDGGGGGKKGPLPKICYTYSAMIKLGTVISYIKKIKKTYESLDTPSEIC